MCVCIVLWCESPFATTGRAPSVWIPNSAQHTCCTLVFTHKDCHSGVCAQSPPSSFVCVCECVCMCVCVCVCVCVWVWVYYVQCTGSAPNFPHVYYSVITYTCMCAKGVSEMLIRKNATVFTQAFTTEKSA